MEPCSPKREVSEMLKGLPEDASYEDIQYHLYVLEKLRRSEERCTLEGALSHGDAKARLAKWLPG